MNEQKTRHTVWLTAGAWDRVEGLYRRDNCSTKNEFIEKAIRFYTGYLAAGVDGDYLPRVLAELLEGKLSAFGDRMGRLLFKLAVNDGMLTALFAEDMELTLPEVDQLRVQCVKEAKYIHGILDLEHAVRSLEET